MPHLLCHDEPELLVLATEVVDSAPGRVALARSPFYPGGGGQPVDQGVLHWNGGEVAVSGLQYDGGKAWHLLADPTLEMSGAVEAAVDAAFRTTMRRLHTGTHILNALVYREFDGALVTGVQMAGDGTARMDFDLPDADNNRLRVLEAPINAVIAEARAVRFVYVPLAEAQAEHGLIRSRSVAPPPTDDGLIRVVEITDLDRQACGGTHLLSTGDSPPLKILKIDNKGRHNRRVRIGLT